MTDTTIPVLDSTGIVRPRAFKRDDDGTGGFKYSAYNAEDPIQRAALLEALSVVAEAAAESGTLFSDVSIASLSVGQAAGTSPILNANPNRRQFTITPGQDGGLYVAAASAGKFFWPLNAGLTLSLSGSDCPTNALYVSGQAANSALLMVEG